jgi:hypothetical protein
MHHIFSGGTTRKLRKSAWRTEKQGMWPVPFAAMLCLLAPQSSEGPGPLRVVAVVRQGMPPYEESDRLYRLEGRGCALLKVDETVVLRRMGEKCDPGRLKVLEAHWDHALAKLSQGGETYPLIDDLAQRIDPPEPLPLLPAPVLLGTPAATRLELRLPLREEPKPWSPPAPVQAPPAQIRSIPESPVPVMAADRRQPIYFIKGDATLSPGALKKLKMFRDSWRNGNAWVLACPGNPGLSAAVQHERIATLRAELGRLGIERVEVRFTSPEGPGKYDVIYVSCEIQQVRLGP